MKRRVFYQSDQHIDFLVGGFHGIGCEARFLALTTGMLPHGDTSNDILVLAGDMWIGKRIIHWSGHSWLKCVAERFFHVIMVKGNHDRFEGCLGDEDSFLTDMAELGITNVSLLENSAWEDLPTNTLFIGATLWTDMNSYNPLCMLRAPNVMEADFKYVRTKGYKRFRAEAWCNEHKKSVQYIDLVCKGNPSKNIVVVTHHAPSYRSVHEMYRGQSNNYYASDLERLAHNRENISHWVHGHTHHSFNYFLDKCNVLCNPYGYRAENTQFDNNAFFEIGEHP